MANPVDPRRIQDRTDRAVARTAELQARVELLRSGRPAEVRPAPDDAMRRVARLEELVARTHERAAQLYETWSIQQGGDTAAGLEQRARRHRDIAASSRSVDTLAERTLDGVVARIDAATPEEPKGRNLATLSALERLRVLTSRRIEHTVGAARAEGATWAEVAAALGVTRQTAHERFRRRAR